jgi:hypothetical protein
MADDPPIKVRRVYYLTERGIMFQKLIEDGMGYDEAMAVIEALT